jgi:hypothetical protein
VGAAVAAAVALLVMYGAQQLLPGDQSKVVLLVEAGMAAIAAGLAYAGVALALRIPELPSMISIVTDLVRRRGRS